MIVERPGGHIFADVIEPSQADWSSAETIILLHGVGAGHEFWRGWLPTLSPGYRLVLMDLRGHGQSVVADPASWTLDDLSDDILAVADLVGVDRFHVIGESVGGTAVLNLCARGEDTVASAVTLSAAHRGAQIEQVAEWRAGIERLGFAAWSTDMMRQRFREGALSAEDFTWFKTGQDRTRPDILLRLGEILLETDLTQRLERIACPMLLISADRSPFVTADIPVEILAAVPQAELCVIPNARHGIFFSHAPFCAGLTAEFLGRQVQQGSARRA